MAKERREDGDSEAPATQGGNRTSKKRIFTSHSICWLLIRSAHSPLVPNTLRVWLTDWLVHQWNIRSPTTIHSVKFNEFCGQPSASLFCFSSSPTMCWSFMPRGLHFFIFRFRTPIIIIIIIHLCWLLFNKCMPIFLLRSSWRRPSIQFSEWTTRFNYHLQSNYKFTELDSSKWMHRVQRISSPPPQPFSSNTISLSQSEAEQMRRNAQWQLLDLFMKPWRKLGGNNY